ncbi:MAG: hypothetical protein IT374_07350 [Polyangiaceae bacterium]|nr:hypothetical protein [Polyangiaceae bacterium]
MRRILTATSCLALVLAACGGSGGDDAPAAGGSAGTSAGAGGAKAGAGGAAAAGAGAGGVASGAGGAKAGAGGAAAGTSGGGASGVPCKTALDCPPAVGTCQVAACDGGACVNKNAPAGPVGIAAQLPGDCRVVSCDASGTASHVADPTDVPQDDGNPCTSEVCNGMTAAHPPAAAGTQCGASGVCNGAGKCGVCKPGEGRCDPLGAASICDASGQWGPPSPCGGGTPVCSSGVCNAVVEVAAGEGHTCARLTDGTVRCWGRNDAGQCGAPASAQPVIKPVTVQGVKDVKQLSLGGSFSCARGATGVSCWGDNKEGQLGDGGTTPRALAAPVASLGAVDALSTGRLHACVLEKGVVKCWGANFFGQLGIADYKSRGEPQPVALPFAVESIALGMGSACASAKGHGILCWGVNATGQLGRPLPLGTSGTATPGLVIAFNPGLAQDYTTVERLYAGSSAAHAFAMLGGGQVAMWGDNMYGEIGYDGEVVYPGASYFLDQTTGLAVISAGENFSCSITNAGGVRCNGANETGQLGRGGTNHHKADSQGLDASLPPPVTSLSAGSRHVCAVSGGKAYCWGSNDDQQLGGAPGVATSPRLVSW